MRGVEHDHGQRFARWRGCSGGLLRGLRRGL
jgi:hypothetical protein